MQVFVLFSNILRGYDGAMLRYRADLRTLAFMGIYAGLVASLWLHAPTQPWLVALLVVVTCFFSFFCAVATHNTVHSPIFEQRWLNRLAQVALTLCYGHPVSAYVPGHNLSHHKYTQTRRDVMRTSKLRYRINFFNFFLFMPTVGADIFRANFRYFKAMYRRHPTWFRQLLLETSIFLGVVVSLAVIDWRKFLLYIVIPHQFAAAGITTMNFLQHDGTDADHPYNHSRNFVGGFVNWWVFNNGFHGIHHESPGLHWSLLPAAHRERIAPHVHAALDQRSLLAYLITAFVWPGKRLRYDGKPVVLPAEGPDEDWIPAPSETPDDVSLGAISRSAS